MNEFIRLRANYLTKTEDYLFPVAYLERLEIGLNSTEIEKEIITQLKYIFQLQQKKELNQKEMISLLSYLGVNDYVDAYIVALFIKNQELFREPAFVEHMHKLLLAKNITDPIIYALLDASIECHTDLFSEELLDALLEKETLSLDTFSMMIDYIDHFRKESFAERIINWLADDYPVTIHIQLIDLYVGLYSLEKLVEKALFHQKNQQIIENYLETLKNESNYAIEGFTILQSMFYGDFENSGKGNNGGLAIFLQNLGTELSKSEEVVQVITLATTKEWSENHSVITEYPHGHLFLNIPIYINKENSTDFLKKEHLIKRTISRYLYRLGLEPDVYHVRFLDNASKAIAQLSEEQDKKLVATLAPDPHRNMTNRIGTFKSFSFSEVVEKLNKIIIGDELILKSDKIVGIGSRVVKEELEYYFPKLTDENNQPKVQMISEGIQTNVSLIKQDEKTITAASFEKMGLTKLFLEKPIILNVGRLNKLKAQDELLKAWIHSDLSAVYNLLIVGGDLENLDTEEKEMTETFKEFLSENQHLKENFLHLGALSNYQVRKLEQKIRAEQKDYPQIYLCSSKKEEFGIAILEALSQKFLVLGPKNGGVKSYIKDGVNGFLIDTTNWKSIVAETEPIIESLKNKKSVFEKIQQAGEITVKNNFSMEIITEDFLSLYLSLQGKE